MDQTKEVFTIADRSYRLVVNPNEKEIFEEAVRQINLHIKKYAEHYAYNDRQDLLSMVALQYSVESLHLKKSQKELALNNNLTEELLLNIEKILDEVL
ncbi:MAG: cell division protein ZapA [Bacteroidales bacterium]|jgi:cell division protein ZapA|nr:cell division protein ZapA [Bacteroidales bacterium]